MQAAGGIVLRRDQPPRVAVVRLSKRDEWVLPKGKLDQGETPRAAARREVLEETGHTVTVHEFLGTLVYEAGGRSKIVNYWSMEASAEPTRELMSDIRAVDWLPLNTALGRLSRESERVFLETVGPLAISAFRARAKAVAARETAASAPAAASRTGTAAVPDDVLEPLSTDAAPQIAPSEPAPSAEEPALAAGPAATGQSRRRSLAQRMRGWFGQTR